MISIARKNLSSFFSNPNFSFLCNSNSHFIHHFSTASLRRKLMKTSCPEIFDVLFRKHHFSFEFASSLASAELTKSATPERADSVLSFMKENSFTNAQLEKIVRYDTRILGYNVDGLQLKLSIFQDLGLSSEEIAKMMLSNAAINPSLSILKGLLGSNDEVARLLRKSGCGWFITHNLDKTLMPNLDILKSSGIPMERVRHFLHIDPRCLLIRPDIMKNSVDKVIEFVVPLTSVVFIHAIGVIARTSLGMWEVKLMILRDFGFSDHEIFSMFRKHPKVFAQTGNKMESVLKLLLGTGKYSICLEVIEK